MSCMTATPPVPPRAPSSGDPKRMTPKVLAAVIGTTVLATLIQVEVYKPRRHWWQRRERISQEALARVIGNNAAMAIAVREEP